MMAWKHLKEATPKARKPHQCWLCEGTIPAGSTYVYRAGAEDGQMVAMHMHTACEAETHDWDAMDWETFSQGDLQTYLNQEKEHA